MCMLFVRWRPFVAIEIIMSAKNERRGSGIKIKRTAVEDVRDRRLGYPFTFIQETAVCVKPTVSSDFLQLPRVDMSCYINKVCKLLT